MNLRRAIFTILGLLAVVAASVLGLTGLSQAQNLVPRLSFQIMTGSTAGTYFPVGQAIAGIVSNPPGTDSCAAPNLCGPKGLVVSAQTSAGSVANILAVNAGYAESGLAQSDVVADAVAGAGPFRRYGPQTHIRIVAALFPEQVHLVASTKSGIASVRDLRGKRVSLGAAQSGTQVTAKAILAAWHVPERGLKQTTQTADMDALALQKGTLDAFFFFGGAPVPIVDDLMASGRAHLVPVDGPNAKRLASRSPYLEAMTIPAGTYHGSGAVPTLGSRALWIVKDSVPNAIVYGMLKALFSPNNRAALQAGPLVLRGLRPDSAGRSLPSPIDAGALRFYREQGVATR